MNSTSKPSVLPLNKNFGKNSISLEKLTSFSKEFQQEIKTEINKLLEEYVANQQFHAKRIESLENTFAEEVNKVQDIFKGLGKEFDKFKNYVIDIIENQVQANIENLTKLQNENSNRLTEIEQTINANIPPNTTEELREELIVGIRMLGKRVSKAIKDMENRFNEFAQQIHPSVKSENNDKTSGIEFGAIKESTLLNHLEGYEIIPKDAVDKLTQLFRKQSLSVKKFIDSQQAKIKEFEQLLKTYDEQNTKLFEMLNNKAKRNFRMSLLGIGLLVALIFIFLFVL